MNEITKKPMYPHRLKLKKNLELKLFKIYEK